MSSSVVDSIGGSYFTWFQDSVLPYIVATIDIIIIIASLILNTLMLITLKKRKLLKIPSNGCIFQLVLVDLFACAFVLIPGSVIAIMKKWELTLYVCYAHAVIATWLYLVSFGLIMSMIIERTLKLKNQSNYKKTFGSKRFNLIISLLLWGILLGISVVPVSGWATVSYDFYHAACVVTHESNVYYLSIVFTLGIGFSIIVTTVCYSIIFHLHYKDSNLKANSKSEEISKNRLESISDTESVFDPSETTSGTMATARTITSYTSGRTEESVGIGKQQTNYKRKSSRLSSLAGIKKLKSAVTKINSVSSFQAIKTFESDPDFHLAITYLILWCMMVFCWFPYFIVSFYHAANYDSGFWRGGFTITIIIANISYCIKPIIYLSHNRHYREYTKQTIPKNVVKRASNIRMSVGSVVDMLDKAVFKSTTASRKLNTAIKTHSIAKNWIKKTRDKKDIASVGRKDGEMTENNQSEVKTIEMTSFYSNKSHVTKPANEIPCIDHNSNAPKETNGSYHNSGINNHQSNQFDSTNEISHTVSVHLGDVDESIIPVSPGDYASQLSPKTAREIDMSLL